MGAEYTYRGKLGVGAEPIPTVESWVWGLSLYLQWKAGCGG